MVNNAIKIIRGGMVRAYLKKETDIAWIRLCLEIRALNSTIEPVRFARSTTYRAAARKLRKIADHLEARCKPKTPRQKAALTSTVYSLSRYAKQLADKHRRTTH